MHGVEGRGQGGCRHLAGADVEARGGVGPGVGHHHGGGAGLLRLLGAEVSTSSLYLIYILIPKGRARLLGA
jgi:hypothetical protein